jgi:hypothetical protein
LKVHTLQVNVDSELAGSLNRADYIGRVEKDLGWDATTSQANAARFILVYDGHLDPRIPLNHAINNVHR